MNPTTLAAALVPVLFVLLLGYWAGRGKRFSQDQAAGLSTLALSYALPAALFVGMTQIKRQLLLQEGPLVLALLICYGGTYLVTYLIARRSKTLGSAGAAILALLVSFPAAPVYGLAVLKPLFGASSTGTVGIVALVCNIALTPVTLVLLARGGGSEKSSKPASTDKPASIGRVVLGALASPLVWAPVLGLLVSLAGWQPPALLNDTLLLLGDSSSGVAIFASGLVLAAHKVQFSRSVWVMSLGKMIVQPVLLLVLLLVFRVHGQIAASTLVATALPSAVLAVLLAAKYHVVEASAATTLFVSSFATIFALPLSIWVSGLLK